MWATWATRRTWTPSTVKAHSRIANAESAFIAYSEDAAMSRSPAQAIAQYGQSAAIADLLTSRAAASEVEAAEAKLEAEGAPVQPPLPIESRASAVKKIRSSTHRPASSRSRP
jgi:hypothetical protein